ncbi:MAG: YgiQ family radical SAM protein [Odoribacteraceae bacterium]|jgi:uncharacterized radical SAM protein YgiQ|nr:YgiQ family radical SAM protein [Odoribacteraceae bacterium]
MRDWLPTTKKEVEQRGWSGIDVILFSGDAYVDHPSFGVAVIGRVLESLGLNVAIVPQPNWQDDLRDFKKLGAPGLFFGICPGSMDSMVNHYTAARRRRSDDAYTPGNRAGARPDMPTIVYTRLLKSLYPDVPVVLGGIEASLRRLTHYDYWDDRLRPSILVESGADLLVYGMGEQPVSELCRWLRRGVPFRSLTNIPQTAVLRGKGERVATRREWRDVMLASHEECARDKRCQAANFRRVEEESNSLVAARLLQEVGGEVVIVNPPFPPMSAGELDAVHDLPFTRLPHPRYRQEIPAYKMIRHSITLHRGCFGGCAFCTISAHQGKFIVSRSMGSVLREVERVREMPDFKGTISDLGGPSANMYAMGGKDTRLCELCKRPSCLFPTVCKNLNADHGPLLELYRQVRRCPGVKHCFVASGIRYDLVMHHTGEARVDAINKEYLETVVRYHVSGRLKVAPEHVSGKVLRLMRKPPFALFEELTRRFRAINGKAGLNQQLIPYFISSHPGCGLEEMAELAVATRDLSFQLEQVQDFTPTPMTLATEMFYTRLHPYSMNPVFSARSDTERKQQNVFFFWYKPQLYSQIISLLKKINRPDLIRRLFPTRGGGQGKGGNGFPPAPLSSL